MTLNGLIALIFHRIPSFAGDCVTVVEDNIYVRKIHSPSYIWAKLTHAAVARSLCDS